MDKSGLILKIDSRAYFLMKAGKLNDRADEKKAMRKRRKSACLLNKLV